MILLILIVIFIGLTYYILRLPQFGKYPSGARLERMKQSPQYRNGQFQNQSETPQLTKGYSYGKVLYDYLIKQKPDRRPASALPVIKTDLHQLAKDQDALVWFGHSSYFLVFNGKTFLIDPVLSTYASPFPQLNKAFEGVSQYSVNDIPFVDYLLITHDHYDHLDYATIIGLKCKVGKIFTGLGVGEHLEKWGYRSEQIHEGDWWDSVALEVDTTLHYTPARHFSGRLFKRNNTLWTSFVLVSGSKKLFLGGDSGYDEHFAWIGERFGAFDWAIMENGQYNEAWRYIHSFPEEAIQAAQKLQAKHVIPVHSAKFDLGGHPWYEPLERIALAAKQEGQALVTPRIGEVVYLQADQHVSEQWWAKRD